ncbi:hypothetical protein JTB14_024642 [Gonioctena quinquepunctata]|nr:hypothetical protein JTB14_024642 [Gonioctena quinquepunctata]
MYCKQRIFSGCMFQLCVIPTNQSLGIEERNQYNSYSQKMHELTVRKPPSHKRTINRKVQRCTTAKIITDEKIYKRKLNTVKDPKGSLEGDGNTWRTLRSLAKAKSTGLGGAFNA